MRKRVAKQRVAPSAEARPLVPHEMYRLKDAARFFGYSLHRLETLIRTGKLPGPMALSDSGRAKAYLGSQILAWQAERVAAAKTKKRAA
jgi:predicted DNA-binding transcriptional regulator AlpA